MLQALTRKFALAKDVDLDAVAAECAPTFTGADLYALAADAWTAALYRGAAEVRPLWVPSTYFRSNGVHRD